MPKIFFSYAWGINEQSGQNRESIVNELYDSLSKDGYELIRDKVDLGYKELISDFMQQIGKGDQIIVALSDKYVRSPYCMFELYEIARNCRFEKEEFRKKVFPVFVEYIDFAQPAILESYQTYWKSELEQWTTYIQKNTNDTSTEQYARFNKVKLINQNISQLMDWLIDMNALNPTILTDNDFAIIKKALGVPASDQSNKVTGEKLTDSVNNTLNDLDKQRLASLTQRLKTLEELKKNYEDKSDLSDDPKEKMRCDKEISDLNSTIQRVTVDIKNITQ